MLSTKPGFEESLRVLESPVGPLELRCSPSGVRRVHFLRPQETPEPAAGPSPRAGEALMDRLVLQLEAYFRGTLRTFDLPLDLEGTPFRLRVWEVLRQIPYGGTASYGAVAARIGSPRACRAVGGANHANPVGILVPCHRVVGQDGSLTGFGGGLAAKAWLLEHERTHLP